MVWYAALVVWTAGCAERDFVQSVVRIAACYAARGCVRRVEQTTVWSCRVIPCWCGRRMRVASEHRLMAAEHAVAADAHSATRSGLF
jgi:hypothetical protein